MVDELRFQTQLTPDPLHGGQPLIMIIDQGDTGAGLGESHAVDARDAGHAE